MYTTVLTKISGALLAQDSMPQDSAEAVAKRWKEWEETFVDTREKQLRKGSTLIFVFIQDKNKSLKFA